MAVSRIIEVSFARSSVALVRIDTAYFYNNGIIFKPTDLDLPASYQVHWADSPQATTTLETIGTAEGAPIPDDLWNRSRVIYGWIYLHPTEDSGITAYEVRIYKNVRAGLPDGTEPTPAEQSTIDQLISALNTAVEQAEDAQEAIENMSVSATTLAEGSPATVTKSEQDGVVHLEFGIPKGATGDDGYSPTANVSKSGKTATITITDKNGTTSAQVSDGTDGTDGIDGVSPTVSVTDITGGHRVVITDKDGAKSFDVEDGATGATPNLTIGTVTTLEPDASATASITGTAEDPVLNLGIPRGQTGEVTEEEFTQLKEEFTEIGEKVVPCIIDENTDFLNGYLTTANGNFTPTSNSQWTTDFIEVDQGVTYNCDCSVTSSGTTQTYPRAICLYKSDKTFSRSLTLPSGIPFTVASNEYYMRLNYNGTLNSLAVYPSTTGKESYYQLNDSTRLPSNYVINVDKRIDLAKYNYIHSRRPIISFILDGEYDLNPTMEAIFASHGYCIGFAPQYKQFGILPTNQYIVDKYLAWQKKGHEILAHLQYVLNDQTTYTDAEAKQIIKESYTTMTAVGLNVMGVIGSNGKVADRFIPTLQKYYDYGATENNHSADLTAVLSFSNDNPYHLWRYSLQTSSPQQTQAAVDACISNNGLLIFYGHARSNNTDYFTAENLEALLTYIDGKVSNLECTVQIPYDAIRVFYSVRYDDVISNN